MIETWLDRATGILQPFTFSVIDITEKTLVDDTIKSYLGEQTLFQYKNIDHLKRQYATESPQKLIDYLQDYVFPTNTYQIAKNVKQGDFGEIITTLVVENFVKLKVPISKLRYKFNKDRSVFCTDLISHNHGDTITDIKYYEIKTRTSNQVNNVAVEAYNGLLRDEQKPTEAIANFLSCHYHEIAETLTNSGIDIKAEEFYNLATQFGNIVKNPSNYNRSFEIVLIIEKKYFKDDILTNLNAISLQLSPLEVTVILIEDLSILVAETFKKANDAALNLVFNATTNISIIYPTTLA